MCKYAVTNSLLAGYMNRIRTTQRHFEIRCSSFDFIVVLDASCSPSLTEANGGVTESFVETVDYNNDESDFLATNGNQTK